MARRNLLWDILRLPSSRRAALGLYVILTLRRGRGANQPPYAFCCIEARRATHCATGKGKVFNQASVVCRMPADCFPELLHRDSSSFIRTISSLSRLFFCDSLLCNLPIALELSFGRYAKLMSSAPQFVALWERMASGLIEIITFSPRSIPELRLALSCCSNMEIMSIFRSVDEFGEIVLSVG